MSYLNMNRRQILAGGAAAFGSLLLPSMPAFAAAAKSECRVLSFTHTHTGEKAKCTYWEQGKYLPDAIKEINHLLRDHRTGDTAKMDKKLLDQLFALHRVVGSKEPIQIISAYRSPHTNEALRKSGGGGVAKKSLHMEGKAMDIRMGDIKLAHLRKAALDMKAGGVGYYPSSNFIHVDTGRVRSWV